MAAGKIFLCYRREDSAGHAGRIYDRLNQRFPGRVFMDVAGIGAGTRWAEVIEQTLGACDVAVILIGRRWLERGPAGTRRLDDPTDPLRAEITTALRLGLKIVPLLVGGAAVPEHNDLPPEVAPIVDWQALRIDDDEFDDDSSRLIAALERKLHEGPVPPQPPPKGRAGRWVAMGGIGAMAVAVILVVLANKNPGPQPLNENTNTAGPPSVSDDIKKDTEPQQDEAAGKDSSSDHGNTNMARSPSVSDDVKKDTEPQQDEAAGKDSSSDHRNTNTARSPSVSDDVKTPPPPPPTTRGTSGKAPAAPQLAGEYVLTSYTWRGAPVPCSGTMRLVPISDGRFQFESSVTNPALGSFQYRGYFQGQGTNWTSTTVQTNDPITAQWQGLPIPFQLSFDGSTLVMRNPYAQLDTVWRKQ